MLVHAQVCYVISNKHALPNYQLLMCVHNVYYGLYVMWSRGWCGQILKIRNLYNYDVVLLGNYVSSAITVFTNCKLFMGFLLNTVVREIFAYKIFHVLKFRVKNFSDIAYFSEKFLT